MVSHASAAHVSSGSRSGNLPSRESDSSRLVIRDRKSTRLNSSHSQISYAVFCLKKKKKKSFKHVVATTMFKPTRSATTTYSSYISVAILVATFVLAAASHPLLTNHASYDR